MYTLYSIYWSFFEAYRIRTCDIIHAHFFRAKLKALTINRIGQRQQQRWLPSRARGKIRTQIFSSSDEAINMRLF